MSKNRKNHVPPKEAAVALVERKARVRSFHVPDVSAETLRPKLKAQIDSEWMDAFRANSVSGMNDAAKGYHALADMIGWPAFGLGCIPTHASVFEKRIVPTWMPCFSSNPAISMT